MHKMILAPMILLTLMGASQTDSTTPAEKEILKEYTDCGCGCCANLQPTEKCVYRSRSESVDKIAALAKSNAPSPQSCALIGCSKGIHYHYCD